MFLLLVSAIRRLSPRMGHDLSLFMYIGSMGVSMSWFNSRYRQEQIKEVDLPSPGKTEGSVL